MRQKQALRKIRTASQKNSGHPSEGTPNNTISRELCQVESGGEDGFPSRNNTRRIFPLTIGTHFGILDAWTGSEIKRQFHRGDAEDAEKTHRQDS